MLVTEFGNTVCKFIYLMTSFKTNTSVFLWMRILSKILIIVKKRCSAVL